MNAPFARILGLGWLLTQTLANATQGLHNGTPSSSVPVTMCRVLTPELAPGFYKGSCLDGLAHGQGLVRSPGPGPEPVLAYSGSFERGQRSGHGQMHYPNGDTYTGQWQNDERNGLGEYHFGPQSPWAGDRYSGQWRDSRFHGQGRYTWAMGDVYEGPWRAGQQMGPATAAQARRQVYVKALLQQLPAAGYRVCALDGTPGKPTDAQVRSVLEDRLQLETHPARPLTWQLATGWRPCGVTPSAR